MVPRRAESVPAAFCAGNARAVPARMGRRTAAGLRLEVGARSRGRPSCRARPTGPARVRNESSSRTASSRTLLARTDSGRRCLAGIGRSAPSGSPPARRQTGPYRSLPGRIAPGTKLRPPALKPRIGGRIADRRGRQAGAVTGFAGTASEGSSALRVAAATLPGRTGPCSAPVAWAGAAAARDSHESVRPEPHRTCCRDRNRATRSPSLAGAGPGLQPSALQDRRFPKRRAHPERPRGTCPEESVQIRAKQPDLVAARAAGHGPGERVDANLAPSTSRNWRFPELLAPGIAVGGAAAGGSAETIATLSRRLPSPAPAGPRRARNNSGPNLGSGGRWRASPPPQLGRPIVLDGKQLVRSEARGSERSASTA